MEASGSAVHLGESEPVACWRWMESSGQGFGVPWFSNHTFQRGGSAWWMIFIGERKLKEACHCSHSLVFVRTLVAPAFILVLLTIWALPVKCFVKAELSSDSWILVILMVRGLHLMTESSLTVDLMSQFLSFGQCGWKTILSSCCYIFLKYHKIFCIDFFCH